MENKKNKIMTLVFIVSMLILVVSTTYAFFAPQQGGTTSTNAIVTSNTTDLLTFSINRDISFTVTQALFAQNGNNQSGDATATATLTPNNKTGSATMNYYLYLNIESNPTVYSEANTNEDPELMLQVFDGSNQLVTLTGLGTQKTIKGVTGYDITGVSGLKTLLNNHAISATNNTATIENWRVVITLINLDVNQNDNTGKEISAEIIIRKDEMRTMPPYLYWNNDFTSTGFFDGEYPNESGMHGSFTNLEDFIYEINNGTDSWYTFSERPYYIKSVNNGNNQYSYQACIWGDNHEICLTPDYSIFDNNENFDGNATMLNLKQHLEQQLGYEIESSDCSSSSYISSCDIFDSFHCYSDDMPSVCCGDSTYHCCVGPGAAAICFGN